jgi:hypothetical protein
VLHVAGGRVVHHAPIVYQRVNGSRREISGSYLVRNGSEVGFRVAAYDRSRPLVIDPVLVYSTYLGGSGEGGFLTSEAAESIAVDSEGAAYVVGSTPSTDFPVVNALQATPAGGFDVFVSKLTASGSALVYSTYLGGGTPPPAPNDWATGIAVDDAGNAYVTGTALSDDFPTVGPIQACDGDDVFISKLNAAGSALIYSTCLGGSASENGGDVAVDGYGQAYVIGNTFSGDFPRVNAFQKIKAGGWDYFVSKLNYAGSALVYSSFLGGTEFEDRRGSIAVDGERNAYVVGTTPSTDFPTASALQAAHAGGTYDAFVAKIDPAGSALTYSTYLGGSGSDRGQGIAVDGVGNAYVTGNTYSTDFPTASPLQAANAGNSDGFVAKLNAAGSALTYSTYLGGSSYDYGYGVAVDGAGNAYVTGSTNSPDFPTASPLQSANGGGYDAFVAQLDASGSAFVYSTYVGGSSGDSGVGIAVDGAGNAYVTGNTNSTDFPTANPLQATHGGGDGDAFVAKLGPSPELLPALSGAGVVLFLLFLLSAAVLLRGRARIRG